MGSAKSRLGTPTAAVTWCVRSTPQIAFSPLRASYCVGLTRARLPQGFTGMSCEVPPPNATQPYDRVSGFGKVWPRTKLEFPPSAV